MLPTMHSNNKNKFILLFIVVVVHYFYLSDLIEIGNVRGPYNDF